ncbi:MAG TPA: hypothetical protein EYG03_21030 [Planctomycetes bacterium]|nr:hypothetical protein [Fuerstiella sp.]HIK94436.1 hypothetical protein [Planctomycetota bacterium]
MKTLQKHPFVILALGVVLGASFMVLQPHQPAKASAANGNDKFSMCTCRVTLGESEAVFVLDHLTGVLSGGFLNSQSGNFSHKYIRTISQDFQINPATPEPKYSMVAGDAQLRTSGGVQPANGLIYVAELTSGAVIAYGFAAPRGRGVAAPLEIFRIDGFPFREASGG